MKSPDSVAPVDHARPTPKYGCNAIRCPSGSARTVNERHQAQPQFLLDFAAIVSDEVAVDAGHRSPREPDARAGLRRYSPSGTSHSPPIDALLKSLDVEEEKLRLALSTSPSTRASSPRGVKHPGRSSTSAARRRRHERRGAGEQQHGYESLVHDAAPMHRDANCTADAKAADFQAS